MHDGCCVFLEFALSFFISALLLGFDDLIVGLLSLFEVTSNQEVWVDKWCVSWDPARLLPRELEVFEPRSLLLFGAYLGEVRNELATHNLRMSCVQPEVFRNFSGDFTGFREATSGKFDRERDEDRIKCCCGL